MQLGSLESHWFKGGFSEAYLAPRLPLTFRWLANFVQTYIERDIWALGYELSDPLLTKLLTMISHVNGNMINVSDLSRSLGVSQPTVNRYLDLLEGIFVLNRLPPYAANVGKRLVRTPKVYLRDSGLLHQLAKVADYDALLGHPVVGASWEGYVIEQIRRVVGTDWSFFYYRTAAGAEIDVLLIAPNGKKVAVEITFSNAPTVSKGFYLSLADTKPDAAFVVIPTGDSYLKAENIWVTNLTDFLTNRLAVFH